MRDERLIRIQGIAVKGEHCYVTALFICDHLGISAPLRFLVDTGNTHTTLTEKTAKTLDIDVTTLSEKPKFKISGSGYEFTTGIGSAGTYYFAFMNENRFSITVTLNVDAGLQTSEVTLTKATTVYSTQVSPYVTEKVTVSTRPVGFGLLFYAGIGLIAVAVIALAISRMKTAAPRTAPPSTSAPVVAQAGPIISPAAAASVGKFCTNCGAALSARASFCNKCGSKQ